ncbi:MAG: hypothetical protein AAGE52_26080 [Myxococcota bacterium]
MRPTRPCDLDWVMGFPASAPPEDARWCAVSLGRAVATKPLTRTDLVRATRALGRKDVALRGLFEVLQRWVHREAALPSDPLAHHPAASPALRTHYARERRTPLATVALRMAWTHWTDVAALRRGLNWLDAHQGSLLEIARRTTEDHVLGLWLLREQHGPVADAPVRFLGQPDVWEIPLNAEDSLPSQLQGRLVSEFRKPYRARRSIEISPAPTLGGKFARWLQGLREERADIRRRSLEAFALLVHPDIAAWRCWWSDVEGAVRTCWKRLEASFDAGAEFKVLRLNLARLIHAQPGAFGARSAKLVQSLPLRPVLFDALRPRLEALPEGRTRVQVAAALAKSRWRQDAARLAEACARWCRSESSVLARLGKATEDRDYASFLDDLAEYLAKGRSLRVYEDVVDEVFGAHGSGSRERELPVQTLDHARLLLVLCGAFDREHVRAVFEHVLAALAELDMVYASDETLAMLRLVAREDTTRVVPILQAVIDHEYVFGRVADVFVRAGAVASLVRALSSGGLASLLRAASKLPWIGHEICPRPVRDGAPPPWAARYPALLHPALGRLASVDLDAEETARVLLRKEFPSPERLARELAALDAIVVPNDAQLRRIAMLRQRLQAPPSFTPTRLARLSEKLDTRAHQVAIELWVAAVDSSCERALEVQLGASLLLRERKAIDVLAPMRSVPAGLRRHAGELIRRREGPPPWDLRDHGPNAAFLDRMRGMGLDVDVWLGRFPRRAATTDGRELHLALEEDPVEVLRMGGHFQTCLAAGNFNYWAAVINAIDINKRVFYARDAEGRVFGRALVTLTDRGRLLGYHAYAHSQTVGFFNVVRSYLRELAAALGTTLVNRGRVSPLLWSRWYADPPVAFAERETFGTRLLERRMRVIPPAQFLAEAGKALAPTPLEGGAWALLDVAAIRGRPELTVQLLPYLEPSDAEPFRLPPILKQIVDAGIRTPMLAQRLTEVALQDRWMMESVRTLSRVDPTSALNVLHRTRSRSARRLVRETDPERLEIAAMAYRELGKRSRARVFFRRAAALHRGVEERARCEAALHAIGLSG